MAVPTLLAATAHSLSALIFWRFMQGLFVPGVIAVIIAYINEEFAGRAGAVMSAYVAGTVFGGFLGRFLTGIIAARWNWQAAFLVLGVLDLRARWRSGSGFRWPRISFPAGTSSIASRHMGAFAKPAPADDLRDGIHGVVFAGGRLHLRKFFSGPPAVSSKHRRAGQRLLRLPARLHRHAAGRAVPGSQRFRPRRSWRPAWAWPVCC